ncbi:MAG: 50S ribosomal protein L18 [Paludibacter sp.]|jgi:large subunit ribosomal protein L18|nr:50S ribosomal protein L18 [Paludibacter sp.]
MTGKTDRRTRIKLHIRKRVSGTAQSPRLTVFRSNTQIYAQLIDDIKGVTLASASSLGLAEKVSKTEQASKVGSLISKAAQEAGITTAVFDRNGYLYHGRVKQLAEAARAGGLKF